METTVQFPPRALSGSSKMLLESVAVLLFSLDGVVFFVLGGAFATGFIVLVEKMSSLKNREAYIIFSQTSQADKRKGKIEHFIVAYPCHHQISIWSLPLPWTSLLFLKCPSGQQRCLCYHQTSWHRWSSLCASC